MLGEGLGGGEGKGAVEVRGAAEAGEMGGEGSGNHRHGRSRRGDRGLSSGFLRVVVAVVAPLPVFGWWA